MQVRIAPIKAYLSRQMDYMDDNDAFAVLTLGSQTQRTRTKMNQKVPIWNEEFVFKCEGSNVLDVKVMDEDQVVNEEIGNCQIDLRPFLNSQKNVEQFFQLKFGKIAAGKILLRIRFDGAQFQPNNSGSIRSHGEMKWYTPTQEAVTQYALHMQKLGNLGLKIGQQGNHLQQNQQSLQPQQSSQQMFRSYPQPQQYSNYQPSQFVQVNNGAMPQTAYQQYRPQQFASYQPQFNPTQQSVSRSLNQPQFQIGQAYQQTNFTPLNQNSRFPLLNEQNYSYIPQSAIYSRGR